LFTEFVMTSFEGFAPLPVGNTDDLQFRGD